MKGLILKDIYCCKTIFILSFVVSLFPMLMLLLMSGGMFAEGSVDSTVAIFPYSMCCFITIALGCSSALDILTQDEASGWDKFSLTMPVSKGNIVSARFIYLLILTGITTTISILLGLIEVVVFGMPFEFMLAVPLCLGITEAAVLAVTFAMCYRFGNKVGKSVYYFLVTAAVMLMVTMILLAFKTEHHAVTLRIFFYGITPLLTIGAGVWAYHFSQKHITVER